MATITQKKAFKAVVGGSSLTSAMKQAGYSDSTAQRTNKLTATKGWQELMDTYLPDEELAAKHRAFLNSEREEIGVKALDMAYKARGNYAPDKTLNLNVEITNDRAIDELADRLEELEQKGTGQSGDGTQTIAVD